MTARQTEPAEDQKPSRKEKLRFSAWTESKDRRAWRWSIERGRMLLEQKFTYL